MGQCFVCANLDRKEFLHPHDFGAGMKLWESIGTTNGIHEALYLLVAASSGGGCAVVSDDSEQVQGRWAGDRIVVVGDYISAGDMRPALSMYGPDGEAVSVPLDAEKLYSDIQKDDSDWCNIGHLLYPIMEEELGVTYPGDSWKDRVYKEGHKPLDVKLMEAVSNAIVEKCGDTAKMILHYATQTSSMVKIGVMIEIAGVPQQDIAPQVVWLHDEDCAPVSDLKALALRQFIQATKGG